MAADLWLMLIAFLSAAAVTGLALLVWRWISHRRFVKEAQRLFDELVDTKEEK